MIVTRGHSALGQLEYTVATSEYDAQPTAPSWLIDAQPRYLNPEREAVATYLVFGRWSGGEWTTHQKMGPATASALCRDAHPLRLDCQPIEYYPKALPIGRQAANLVETSTPGASGPSEIVALPSDRFAGGVRSHGSVWVASNSFLFKTAKSDIRPLLGLGLLFAEDLAVDTLRLPRGDMSARESERLTDLLGSVRLGLEFT